MKQGIWETIIHFHRYLKLVTNMGPCPKSRQTLIGGWIKYYAYPFHLSGVLATNARHEYDFKVVDQKTSYFINVPSISASGKCETLFLDSVSVRLLETWYFVNALSTDNS